MAIFVVLATIAGVVIVALTTSSGDSFEDAGRSDIGEAGTSSGFAEGSRRPNEIRDPALESMGLRGVIQDLPPELAGHWHGKQSKNIGYRPYCPPWEYLTKGPNEKGEYEYDPTAAGNANIGGPEGAGGVYSSKPGCFAPCYMSYHFGSGTFFPRPSNLREMSLHYFNNNRPPALTQIRLGVNYLRATEVPPNHPNFWAYTDVNIPGIKSNKDRKPIIWTASIPRHNGPFTAGSRHFAGSPIPPTLGPPTVYIPNFASVDQDPAVDSGDLKDRNVNNSPPDDKDTDNDGAWADENWEWRADPINRTCTIVNVTQNDRIVCSSEWQNCASRS